MPAATYEWVRHEYGTYHLRVASPADPLGQRHYALVYPDIPARPPQAPGSPRWYAELYDRADLLTFPTFEEAKQFCEVTLTLQGDLG